MLECSSIAVPEVTEEALRYYYSGNILWVVEQLWSLFVPSIFLIGGITKKLQTFSQKRGKVWFFTILIYIFFFILIYETLFFPLDFYAGFLREHAYGLSSQTFIRWLSHYLISAFVLFCEAAAFVWIFYLLIAKSPKKWWFYCWVTSVAILFFLSFIQPIWIDPLFNIFSPMKDKALEKKILQLASKADIPEATVLEVSKSKDTKTLNAYVTGLGSSKRIVLWDTTVKALPLNELLFVMGHEMGHYVLHHIWWGFFFACFINFWVFYFVYKLTGFLLKKFPATFPFHLFDIASLPLLLFFFAFFSILILPIQNLFSRHYEHEADRFGIEITQNNSAAAKAFVTLYQHDLVNPNPGLIYTFVRATHPSIKNRIDFINSYCPWKEGRSLKYEKYFHPPTSENTPKQVSLVEATEGEKS